MTGNTDPRATLVKHRIYGFTGADVKCMCGWGWGSTLDYPAHQAEALAEADRAAGIVRVRVDEETVERVARVLANAEVLDYWDGFLEIQRALFRDKARAVLSALRGES